MTAVETSTTDWAAMFAELDAYAQAAREPGASWKEVDLAEVLAGDLTEDPPVFLRRADGPALLYRGKVSGIHGEPETCKGWFALAGTLDVLDQGEPVVYVDFEDSARSVVARLLAMGAEERVLRDRFHYLQPEEPLDKHSQPLLADLLDAVRPGLVVLDGVTQAVSNQGLKSNDNDEIGKFFRLLPRWIARRWDAAVLLIDHVTKSSEERRFALGAQQKLAAIDGAQFSAVLRKPFAPGRQGHVSIDVAKDRPAEVRRHAVGNRHVQRIAEMHLVSDPEHGTVSVALHPPDVGVAADGAFRPKDIMERLSRFIEDAGTRLSRRESIFAAVTGKKQTQIRALDLLAAEGYVIEEQDGRARAYRSLKPYRGEDAPATNTMQTPDIQAGVEPAQAASGSTSESAA